MKVLRIRHLGGVDEVRIDEEPRNEVLETSKWLRIGRRIYNTNNIIHFEQFEDLSHES